MLRIFSDFEILKLIKDHEAPGVFLKARKPFNYSPNNLQDIALYSMILGKRITSIPRLQEIPLLRKTKLLKYNIITLIRTMTKKLLLIK